jgi:outer membrane protein
MQISVQTPEKLAGCNLSFALRRIESVFDNNAQFNLLRGRQRSPSKLRDLQDTVARDVRNSWLTATTAYQRVDVSRQLLQQANLSLDLAQTRYKLGLGSIVELSQAQLQQTQAQIGSAQATYEYRLSLRALQFQVGTL